jgi:hypothetical protein
MSSPPVPVVSPPEQLPAPPSPSCENCGAPLSGEYCAACGQRHEPHVHSLGHFAGEAFESITHADSRLWRTLGYLLAKPGRLTREFFDGRRARFMPPFRLYLVISLLFFLVAGLPDRVDTDDEKEGPPTAESIRQLEQGADQLEKQGTPGMAPVIKLMREEAAKQQAEIESGKVVPSESVDAEGNVQYRGQVKTSLCDDQEKAPGPGAGTGAQWKYQFCRKISTMSGQALLDAFVHNIPRAMFVFLPLLAGVMKLLYWRPKRYYVEHLLLLVHNHAFVFLALALITLSGNIPGISAVVPFIAIGTWLYMIWYIFRAMRVYYEQSRWLTFAKYVILGFAYAMTSALVLAGTALYSAIML